MQMDIAANINKAANVLLKADALLICTGAGMGVDSGLGTFRGRNAGVWAPLKALRLDFSELSDPSWFDSDPRLAWAFWRFRHQAYTKGSPHAGYGLLSKWGSQMKHGLFSVTSNIDGHWARTEGVGPERIHECHGALTHMQLVDDRDQGYIWPTDDSQISNLKIHDWNLEPGEAVEVRIGPVWSTAKVGDDGATVLSTSGTPVSAEGVRRPGGPDLFRISEDSLLPTCPETGQPARPNVLMFGDWGVNMSRISEQGGRFETWYAKLPADASLAIVEIGAGKAVPTIRMTSERFAREFKNSSLIRINWDDSDVPHDLTQRSISLGGIGALAALQSMDSTMSEISGASQPSNS
eukprot:TRINITY_DN93349_c0_g1_i1.p1 TRINITY_DN93349_c0_g1~~TRINITY_DN93349_c0_g1_i1.p1  ORF type:complete len:351 (-),score=37.33 TRINITY_DN93349_c0_g1_i1:108-1160(-)